MNYERDDERDDEVRNGLRGLYAPPTAVSYWVMLERRIMARITAEGRREWWAYFPAWSRIGLAAAALALLVAGIAAWQTQKAQERVALQELFEAPADLPVLETLGAESRQLRREQTLRYLLER
ncbi:MAG TPA: hypothetical protein VF178_02090 [Gemmatimonadaceae bacterium]